MIENKFLYFLTYSDFKNKLDAGLINGNSIAFIEDSSLIWTHGNEFGNSTPINLNEEDLAIVNDKIQFADKDFDPSVFSGLGRKYLRKNIVSRQGDDSSSDDSGQLSESNEAWVVYTAQSLDILVFYSNGKFYLPHIKEDDEGTLRDCVIRIDVDDVARAHSVYFTLSDSMIVEDLALDYSLLHLQFNTDTLEISMPDGSIVNANHVVSYGYPFDKWNNYSYFINLLDDTMVNTPNTVYVVLYDYDLDGAILAIPENCVLRFDGGSISNGILIGQNTLVVYGKHKDGCFKNVQLLGTWASNDGPDLPIYTGSGDASIILNTTRNVASGTNSVAEGNSTQASGLDSHAEGFGAKALGEVSHAEGNGTTAGGNYSHAEGVSTTASGERSHAEGNNGSSVGEASHSEGKSSNKSGMTTSSSQANVISERSRKPFGIAYGIGSHNEGTDTVALGDYSHAEGEGTNATGQGSHSEGKSTNPIPEGTIAVNLKDKWNTTKFSCAWGLNSHVEGKDCLAEGDYSHSEGTSNYAGGNSSHAEGSNTVATNAHEHAEGKFNKSNTGTRHSVGIGTSNNDRKNAVEIMDNGDVYVDGVGGYDGTNAGASGVLTLQDEMAHSNEFIFDVTKENSGATFASLSDLLSSPDLSTLIPTSVRTGGMTIRFVLTSGNKYVQYFLTKNEWSASEADWQKLNLEDEVSQLGQKLDGIVKTEQVTSPNIFDKTTITRDVYVNRTTGSNYALSGYNATDYIPVNESGIYFDKFMFGGVAIGGAVYDSNKVFLRGLNTVQYEYATGDAFVRLTVVDANLDSAMAVIGTQADLPAEYVPYGTYDVYSLADKVVHFDAIAFTAKEIGKNKLNPAEIVDGDYINRTDGTVGHYVGLSATGFIPVSENGLIFNHYYIGGVAIGGAVYNADKQYIREARQIYIYAEGDAYVRWSLSTENKATAQVEEGSVVTSFVPYETKDVIDPQYIPNSSGAGADAEKMVPIVLPDKLFAVVGDTLQVFFKQCIQSVNAEKYNILVSCSKGRQYHRYFEYTPTAQDVGETTFTLLIKNDFGAILGNETCILKTIPVSAPPASTKKILCIGDSLTANGKWPAETYRRLTGTGGTPTADGLSNISFVGSMTKDGAGYLGHSGWAWQDYCTEGRPAFRFTVGTSVSINVGAVYRNNSYEYTVIEVSDNGTILCSTSSSENTPQVSGTLTLVRGGGDATVAYSAYVADSQNPFWDGTKLTFMPYINSYCGGSIDEVFVLLGANGLFNWKNDFSDYIAYIEEFADTLHAEYPSAKLVLLGMQLPSMELMMPGYGASGSSYADTYGILVSILRMRKAYKQFAGRVEYSSYVSYIDLGCQFDGDYNYPVTEKSVNTRNTALTEPYDNNTIHPGDDGYMQYADAVYRKIMADLQS